jgi:hypothetical protein
MSIFNWFSSHQSKKSPSAEAASARGPADAKAPQAAADKSHPGSHKSERLEQREHLYSVVRDTMIRAGVLGGSYKFKVLSLDARGVQFLIMMDLAEPLAGHAGRLAEIEGLIVQAAKARYDIGVTAVYWRVNVPVKASHGHRPSAAAQAPRPMGEEKAVPAAVATQPTSPSRYEPLQQDEVAAFKRALASAAPAAPLSASGQIVTSGRRNPAPPVEFEDTHMADSDRRAPPLSNTQYGDLN